MLPPLWLYGYLPAVIYYMAIKSPIITRDGKSASSDRGVKPPSSYRVEKSASSTRRENPKVAIEAKIRK